MSHGRNARLVVCPQATLYSANTRLHSSPTVPQSPRQGPSSPPSLRQVPEILRPDHFCVVHHFALVGGDLQGGQHVVHSGEVGGRTRRHAVELPLQDVEARPPGHMGALQQRAEELRTSRQPSNRSDKLQGEGVLRARHQETAWQRPSTYWMEPAEAFARCWEGSTQHACCPQQPAAS